MPGVHRFVDWLGRTGATASYRVAAADWSNRTSAPSAPATASTRAMSDDELLTMLQEAAFHYYWEGADSSSGMAHENMPGDDRIVATGASGFGIMALLAGVDRGFITRAQGLERLTKIVSFLERADRYHGAWSHYMNGATGHTMAVFGMLDDGGDLVETAFLMQGLLTARQYFKGTSPAERAFYDRITRLWESVEWDWYRDATQQRDFIYWHWSPKWGFQIHHPLIGFNEVHVVYLLAIASPTHGVPASTYYSGWASQAPSAQSYREGWSGSTDGKHYGNGKSYFGIPLDVGVGTGGPLFFAHYSYIGVDPHQLHDKFTSSYFQNFRNMALINRAYCIANPKHQARLRRGRVGTHGERRPVGVCAARAGRRARYGDAHADWSARVLPVHARGVNGRVQALLPRPRRRAVGYLRTARRVQPRARTGCRRSTWGSTRRRSWRWSRTIARDCCGERSCPIRRCRSCSRSSTPPSDEAH